MVVCGWIQPQAGMVCTTQHRGRELGDSIHKIPDFQLLMKKKNGRSKNTCLGVSSRVPARRRHSPHHSLLPLEHAAVVFITIQVFSCVEKQFSESVSIIYKNRKTKLEQDGHMLFLHSGRP